MLQKSPAEAWEAAIADTLGWRMKFGVLMPSTNTSVQPEYDATRPPGVTNHVHGFRIPNATARTLCLTCRDQVLSSFRS